MGGLGIDLGEWGTVGVELGGVEPRGSRTKGSRTKGSRTKGTEGRGVEPMGVGDRDSRTGGGTGEVGDWGGSRRTCRVELGTWGVRRKVQSKRVFNNSHMLYMVTLNIYNT